MRINEITYQNHLAFNDEDRKTTLHNDICLYLTQSEKIKKMAEFLKIKPIENYELKYSSFLSEPIYDCPPRQSYASSKIGGYIDVAYVFETGERIDDGDLKKYHIFIEVKSQKQNITDIIQQIKTYRSFAWSNFRIRNHSMEFVLCTAYRLSKIEKSVLERENIKWIYIDEETVKQAFSNLKD